jgi:hypothetical protein
MSHVDSIKRLSKAAEVLNDQAGKIRVEAEQSRTIAVNLDAKADAFEAEALALEKSIEALESVTLGENVLTLDGAALPSAIPAVAGWAGGGYVSGASGTLFGAGEVLTGKIGIVGPHSESTDFPGTPLGRGDTVTVIDTRDLAKQLEAMKQNKERGH